MSASQVFPTDERAFFKSTESFGKVVVRIAEDSGISPKNLAPRYLCDYALDRFRGDLIEVKFEPRPRRRPL